MVFSKSSTEDALVMGGGQSKLRGFWIMRVSKVSPKDQQKEQYANEMSQTNLYNL